MKTRLISYHRKHWWKLWPQVQLTKAGSGRILEILFSRYGLQFLWSVTKRFEKQNRLG